MSVFSSEISPTFLDPLVFLAEGLAGARAYIDEIVVIQAQTTVVGELDRYLLVGENPRLGGSMHTGHLQEAGMRVVRLKPFKKILVKALRHPLSAWLASYFSGDIVHDLSSFVIKRIQNITGE